MKQKPTLTSSLAKWLNGMLQEQQELVAEFNEIFAIGKVYASFKLLQSAVTAYGQKHNIVIQPKYSNLHATYFWCKNDKHKLKPANKKHSQEKADKINCGCYIKAKIINGDYIIQSSYGLHNHHVPFNPNLERTERDELKTKTLDLIYDQEQTVISIKTHLTSIGVIRITKIDIDNLIKKVRSLEKSKDLFQYPKDDDDIKKSTQSVVKQSKKVVKKGNLAQKQKMEKQSTTIVPHTSPPPSSSCGGDKESVISDISSSHHDMVAEPQDNYQSLLGLLFSPVEDMIPLLPTLMEPPYNNQDIYNNEQYLPPQQNIYDTTTMDFVPQYNQQQEMNLNYYYEGRGQKGFYNNSPSFQEQFDVLDLSAFQTYYKN